jgi:hypothetical protein
VDWSRRKIQTPESDEANEPGLHLIQLVFLPLVYLRCKHLTGFIPDETTIPSKKPADTGLF